MAARVEKIKGVTCSFVFLVLLFLTAALADECWSTTHIYTVLRNSGDKVDTK